MRRAGRYGLKRAGVFLWRLQSYPLRRVRAGKASETHHDRLSFHPLGRDMPLALEVTHVLDEVPPHLIADQLVAETRRAAGAPVALYVVDIAGSQLIRLAGSEDFSRVLDAVPGAMVFLGATPADRDPQTAPFNHAADAAFDDSVLADGAAAYADFALRSLAAGAAA